MAELLAFLHDTSLPHPPLAPPFLVHGKAVVGQTAAILLYLGPLLGLVAKSEVQRLWTHQILRLVEGLLYALPKACRRALKKTPHVAALHERVKGVPRVAAYLASSRRIAFNEDGIFRRYPELDR